MSKVPFMPNIRTFPLSGSEIESRFTEFLTGLRKRRADTKPAEPTAADADDDELFYMRDAFDLSARDHSKIRRRSKRLVANQEARSGLAHLKAEDRKRLKTVAEGVLLNGPSTVHAVDEMASRLMHEMPWMQPVIKPIWQDARQHIARGGLGLWHRPVIVAGPPGIGKSHFARRIATLSRLPKLTIDVGGGSAGFAVAGVQRGWGSAAPGRPVETMLSEGIGNPVVVVDEICKAGNCYSGTGASTSIVTSLLGLLEPVSAQFWECPYFNVSFDMSHICWIMTANVISSIPAPLRSRCRVIELNGLADEDLLKFVEHQAAQRNLGQEDVDVVARLISAYPPGHPALNLRVVARHLDDLEAVACAPVRH
ncbi:AAA family ATPase [Antarcticimicrobium sediminis]|nr:AAA family ATPase [Antarcticimicrobium sediminis]